MDTSGHTGVKNRGKLIAKSLPICALAYPQEHVGRELSKVSPEPMGPKYATEALAKTAIAFFRANPITLPATPPFVLRFRVNDGAIHYEMAMKVSRLYTVVNNVFKVTGSKIAYIPPDPYTDD